MFQIKSVCDRYIIYLSMLLVYVKKSIKFPTENIKDICGQTIYRIEYYMYKEISILL